MVWCGVLRTGLVGRSEPKSPGPLFDPSQPLPVTGQLGSPWRNGDLGPNAGQQVLFNK